MRMCGHGHYARGHHARGLRGFGRGGFPNREEWLERLQSHQQRLEEDLRNVQELIERLQPAPEEPASV